MGRGCAREGAPGERGIDKFNANAKATAEAKQAGIDAARAASDAQAAIEFDTRHKARKDFYRQNALAKSIVAAKPFTNRRRDPRSPDVVLTGTKIIQNTVRNCRQRVEKGGVVVDDPEEFNWDDITADILALGEPAEMRFWKANSTQIEVMAGEGDDSSGLITQLQGLGDGFYNGLEVLRLTIFVGESIPGSVGTAAGTRRNRQGKLVYPGLDHTITSKSAHFRLIEKIVPYLEKFTALKSLTLVLYNFWGTPILPFTHAHLYYALPLYDLYRFQDWNVAWMNKTMTELVMVTPINIEILNQERAKMNAELKQSSKKKAVKKSEVKKPDSKN
jgi:hypothetical protein